MPHQTFLVLRRARVPPLKVSLTAFAPAHGRKIEEDSSEVSFGCRVLPRELAQENELLRSRVLDRRKRTCADIDPELQRFPIWPTSDQKEKDRGGHAPCLAKVSRITHKVDRFFIIDGDDDATLVAKLVFVGLAADHRPCYTSVGAQESIGLFVRAEGGANRADAHHEPGSGGGEYASKVMRDGDGM